MYKDRVFTASYDEWFELVFNKVPDVVLEESDFTDQGMYALDGKELAGAWMPNNQYWNDEGTRGNCWLRES
jgi:hypothetical protein